MVFVATPQAVDADEMVYKPLLRLVKLLMTILAPVLEKLLGPVQV